MPNVVFDLIAGFGTVVVLLIAANLIFGPENVGFLGGFICGVVGWWLGQYFVAERLERWWYRQNAP